MGEVGRPHGVRGLVHLRAYTADPASVAAYGPLTDEAGGRAFVLTLLPGGLARVEGVADREAAARLTGTRLYADRDRLPPPDAEEYYLADLIGLEAFSPAGAPLGRVRAVEEHGAGPFLAIGEGEGEEALVPFTRLAVPVVDLAAGRLTVVLPDAVEVRGDLDARRDGSGGGAGAAA